MRFVHYLLDVMGYWWTFFVIFLPFLWLLCSSILSRLLLQYVWRRVITVVLRDFTLVFSDFSSTSFNFFHFAFSTIICDFYGRAMS